MVGTSVSFERKQAPCGKTVDGTRHREDDDQSLVIDGVWTIIAPWVVSGNPATTSTILSNVTTGAAIVVFGLAATAMGMLLRR